MNEDERMMNERCFIINRGAVFATSSVVIAMTRFTDNDGR